MNNLVIGLGQKRGEDVVEINYQGYSRCKTYWWSWFRNNSGLLENLFKIKFGVAEEDWGYITHILIFQNDELIGSNTMDEAQSVCDEDVATFPSGNLTIDLIVKRR